jgi:uncharacterized membrane-anchored protein
MRSAIAVIACVASLALVNWSIYAKERLLATGAVVLLELAPVDPRSLMQGDYMALRFKIANDAGPAVRASSRASTDGRMVAAIDERRVAAFRRLHEGEPPASGELLLRYRVRNGEMKFATNAFFFQEGTAPRYQAARYGEFRVAPNGDMLLARLRDQDLKPL